MRFLIVDDNRDLANGLSDMLQLEGHVTTVAATATAARTYFDKDRFDYVFLDMKLPDGNGLDLFYEFLEVDPGASIYVMTGFRLEQLLQQVVEDGAVGILRKPFSLDQVVDALRSAEPRGIILVADDDPEFPDRLAGVLSESGHHAVVSRDSRNAVNMVNDNDTDVLILDLKLPVLYCVQVYLHLRKQGKEVPTIIITGHGTGAPGSVDQFRRMSVTSCLFKPFGPEEILSAISASEVAPAEGIYAIGNKN